MFQTVTTIIHILTKIIKNADILKTKFVAFRAGSVHHMATARYNSTKGSRLVVASYLGDKYVTTRSHTSLLQNCLANRKIYLDSYNTTISAIINMQHLLYILCATMCLVNRIWASWRFHVSVTFVLCITNPLLRIQWYYWFIVVDFITFMWINHKQWETNIFKSIPVFEHRNKMTGIPVFGIPGSRYCKLVSYFLSLLAEHMASFQRFLGLELCIL
jgi:hypothetical protein